MQMNEMERKGGRVQQHQHQHAHHILDSRAGLALLSTGKWMDGGTDGKAEHEVQVGGGGKVTRIRV